MKGELFFVWNDDDDRDSARQITEYDAEEAAAEWARREDWHGSEYRIASGTEVTVVVEARDGTQTRWTVVGAAVPSYRVRKALEGKR